MRPSVSCSSPARPTSSRSTSVRRTSRSATPWRTPCAASRAASAAPPRAGAKPSRPPRRPRSSPAVTTTTAAPTAPPGPDPAGWRRRLRRADARWTPYAMVSPFFLLFAVFGLFPLLYTAWVSAHDWSLLAGDEGWLGLGNYRELMADTAFWNAMLNTFAMFVIATVPQLVLAMVLAQLLNSRLRGATFWRMGIL